MKTKPPQQYIKRIILVPVPTQTIPKRQPPKLDRLQGILCHGDSGEDHPLPALCAFAGMKTSRNGQPAAAYKCPLCGTKHHYVNDHHTGKPVRLWTER